MKKVLMIGCLLGLGSMNASAAWDIKNNPDRFISIGVHSGVEHLSGDYSSTVNPGPNEIDLHSNGAVNTYATGFDIRVPFVDQVTFTFAYDKLHRNGETVRDGNTYQTYEGTHGERFDIGARFYFTK